MKSLFSKAIFAQKLGEEGLLAPEDDLSNLNEEEIEEIYHKMTSELKEMADEFYRAEILPKKNWKQ